MCVALKCFYLPTAIWSSSPHYRRRAVIVHLLTIAWALTRAYFTISSFSSSSSSSSFLSRDGRRESPGLNFICVASVEKRIKKKSEKKGGEIKFSFSLASLFYWYSFIRSFVRVTTEGKPYSFSIVTYIYTYNTFRVQYVYLSAA